jgi:predicted phosphohydrolase
MAVSKDKYLWFTDLHLDKVLPWTLMQFVIHILKENPKGVFLTGDLSNGLLVHWHLKLLATFIKCPIYFVLGNHDYHFSSIEKVHDKIRKACKARPNLIWMTDAGVIKLSDEVALIGTEGWYDADKGKPKYLQFTFDWFMTEDFRKLPDMKARMAAWQKLAEQSADKLSKKLNKALASSVNSIYVLTHFPPWKEATHDMGSLWEPFWLPYNVNLCMGKMLVNKMSAYEEKHITVLAGHTHSDSWIHVSRNVECKVIADKYYGLLRNEEVIYI